jgi:hypothetical protein
MNSCAPLSGFEHPGPLGNSGLFGRTTGTGCLDSQGNGFTVHYMYHNWAELRPGTKAYFETGLCAFHLGGRTPTERQPAEGKCRGQVLGAPALVGHEHGQFVQPAWLWRCGKQPELVPYINPYSIQ